MLYTASYFYTACRGNYRKKELTNEQFFSVSKNMFNVERGGLCIGTRSGMLSVKRDSNVIKLDIQPLL